MSSESTIEKASKRKILAAEDLSDHREEERDDDDAGDEESAPDVSVSSGPKEKAIIDRPSSAKMVWTIAQREISA